MNQPKRVLFIGGYGHHYLRQAVQRGLAEAVAWASDGIDEAAARAAAAERLSSSIDFHADACRAMDDVQPDVVNVGAVYAHNGPLVIEALRRGIPVVSDKPVVATEADYERLAEVCQRPDAPPLVTEFDLRSRPAFRAARLAVERGLVGEPVLATAQKSYRFNTRPDFYKDRDQYGGTLLWIASHGIDLVHYVTGIDYAGVTGVAGNVSRPGYGTMEDHVVACYDLANGGSAVVHADFLRPVAAPSHGDDRLRLAGTQGVVEVRDNACTLITEVDGPADITATGDQADLVVDILAAIDGQCDVFGTARSLHMARLLLDSRAAVDDRTRRPLT